MVEKPEPYEDPIELLQGTLDLPVLQTLTWGPQHGYGITAAIRAGSRDALQVDTGSLYPALHRLEKEGSVDSEWKTSENKQRVKVYRLTAVGRRRLTAERSRWTRLLEAMSGNRLVRGVEHSLSGVHDLWFEADRYREEWQRGGQGGLREDEIHPRLEQYLDFFSDDPPEEQPSAPSS